MSPLPFNPPLGKAESPGDSIAPELPTGPYGDSEEHLWDELRRIDQMVRAQTVRWRSNVS